MLTILSIILKIVENLWYSVIRSGQDTFRMHSHCTMPIIYKISSGRKQFTIVLSQGLAHALNSRVARIGRADLHLKD